MRQLIARGAKALIRRCGFDLVRFHSGLDTPLPADMDEQAANTIRRVRAYTMTSPERLFALIQAVRHVCAASVPGDIVECGVWRGGSMMAVARTLLECGDQTRNLYLFDTFEGMSAPTGKDIAIDGQSADALLESQDKRDPNSV